MTLDDLAIHLEAGGFGLTQAVNLFAGELPDSPDDVVALLLVGGPPPERVLDSPGINIDKPRVQVLVRAKDYQDAQVKIGNIFLDLAQQVNTTINGVRYIAITPMQSPFLLKRDEALRPVMVFNVDIDKEP